MKDILLLVEPPDHTEFTVFSQLGISVVHLNSKMTFSGHYPILCTIVKIFITMRNVDIARRQGIIDCIAPPPFLNTIYKILKAVSNLW